MRSILALLVAVAVAGCDVRAEPSRSLSAIRVDAVAAPLDPKDAAHVRLGAFAYAGGVALSSPDTSRLHGLSGFRLDADGRFVAVSDDGDLVRARLLLNPDTTVAGLADASVEPQRGQDGQPFQAKAQADAESMAIWPNGDLMIAYERNHRIWLYPAAGGSPRPIPMPDIPMGDNEGMEGLALAPSRGPDAYWVGIETGAVFLCRLSGGCAEQAGLPRPGLGYRLSELTETPRGELILLHHGWNPLTNASRMRLLILANRPGAPPRLVDRLAMGPDLTIDNYEGLDVAETPGAGLRIFLLSDDNFSDGQRTLLTAFDWRPEKR